MSLKFQQSLSPKLKTIDMSTLGHKKFHDCNFFPNTYFLSNVCAESNVFLFFFPIAKPKRVPMGENCVVCGMSFPQREHVARHFQDELLEITKTFDSPLSCAFCPFTADRIGKSTQEPLNIWTEHSNCQIHSRGDSKTHIALLIPNNFFEFLL